MEDMPSEWVLCPSVIRSEDNYNEESDDNAGEVDSTKRRRTRASYSFRGHPWSDDSSDDGDKSSKHAKARSVVAVKEEGDRETTRRSTRMYRPLYPLTVVAATPSCRRASFLRRATIPTTMPIVPPPTAATPPPTRAARSSASWAAACWRTRRRPRKYHVARVLPLLYSVMSVTHRESVRVVRQRQQRRWRATWTTRRSSTW